MQVLIVGGKFPSSMELPRLFTDSKISTQIPYALDSDLFAQMQAIDLCVQISLLSLFRYLVLLLSTILRKDLFESLWYYNILLLGCLLLLGDLEIL